MQDRRDLTWRVTDRRMPDHGWALRAPEMPELVCRWCGITFAIIAGYRRCPQCDVPDVHSHPSRGEPC